MPFFGTVYLIIDATGSRSTHSSQQKKKPRSQSSSEARNSLLDTQSSLKPWTSKSPKPQPSPSNLLQHKEVLPLSKVGRHVLASVDIWTTSISDAWVRRWFPGAASYNSVPILLLTLCFSTCLCHCITVLAGLL